MKKLNIITLAVIFFSLSAFAQSAKAPVLKNRTDSLNFALGLFQGSQIKTHPSFDSTTDEHLNSLMKGINAGMKMEINPEHAELVEIGTNIGQSLRANVDGGLMGIPSLTVNFDLIKQGIINGIFGFDQMSANEAQMYVNSTIQLINRRAGEAFLAENATQEGVVTLPSGLQYKIIVAGDGRIPTADDVVRVHYHGTLINGAVFDSSVLRGQDITFPVGGVIRGWTEALQLMPVGSKWILYIPQELAYGGQDTGRIQPYSALIFEVELLGIE
jgi:FKBP-type peptidyl-prolyl cis-trans isomerase FklB